MLQDNPDMTQREIAEKLGISTSGLNYCLKALIDKGWVKVQNFSQSKNKFGYIYVLTPQGITEKLTQEQDTNIKNDLKRVTVYHYVGVLDREVLPKELQEQHKPSFVYYVAFTRKTIYTAPYRIPKKTRVAAGPLRDGG